MATRVRFRETQYVREHWLVWLLIPVSIFMIGFAVYFFVNRIVRGVPVGSGDFGDVGSVVFCVAYFLMGVALFFFFVFGRLLTEVRNQGVFVRFAPLHRSFREYRHQDIVEFSAVTYRPIRDYGGWGLRYGRKGRALNVTGNRGVQLTFVSDRPLMIGSQRPEEMVRAIREAKEN